MQSGPVSDSEETAWRVSVAKLLNGADASTLVARSRDGIAIGPLYLKPEFPTPQPWRETDQPIGIITRVDHPDPVEASRLARSEVENGATGLALVLAGATAARGFGIAVQSGEDLATVLDHVPLETLTLRLDLSSGGYGFVRDALTGLGKLVGEGRLPLALDIGFDPLGDQARTGIVDPDMAKAVASMVDALLAQGVGGSILRADGRPYHEAGASEAQELAAVLATGVSYLRASEPSGLEAARHLIGFTLVADADQFLTMTKLRALRRLWARIEQACGLAPMPIHLHAETAWRMLTRRDDPANLLRNTIAAAAAILGGADSLTVLPHTSTLGLPDAFARRLARTTPLVLLEEAHLGRVADTAAGSGGFEALTEALCEEAWRLFQGLERAGGLTKALEAGTWQAMLAQTRADRRADVQDGKTVIVGVTRFMPADDPALKEVASTDRESTSSRFALPSQRDAELFEATA